MKKILALVVLLSFSSVPAFAVNYAVRCKVDDSKFGVTQTPFTTSEELPLRFSFKTGSGATVNLTYIKESHIEYTEGDLTFKASQPSYYQPGVPPYTVQIGDRSIVITCEFEA